MNYKDLDTKRLWYLSICADATSEVLKSNDVNTTTKLECAAEFVEVAQMLAAGRR